MRDLGTIVFLGILSLCSVACVTELDSDSDDHERLQTTEQAIAQDKLDVTCPTAPGCVFLTNQPAFRARFAVRSPFVAGHNSWTYLRTSTRISGCNATDTFCELDLRASCAETLDGGFGRRRIAVGNQRSTFRPFVPNTLWVGFIDIPVEGCSLQACTAPPTQAPALTISSDFCRGRHDRTWTAVSGATYYQGQAKPMLDYGLGIGPTTPWENIPTGWSYPGVMIDTSATECRGDSSSSYKLRMRACNQCGCGPWSWEQVFEYWTLDCA